MQRHINIIIASIAFIAIASAVHAGDDLSSFWLALNSPKSKLNDTFATKTHAELRFSDFETLGYYRLSQKFYTNLNSNWTLGSHPVFENSKKGDHWNHTLRLDLELNPKKIALGENGPTLNLRNRWELRWKEGKGSEIFHRIRQHTKLSWKLSSGPFGTYAIGNEVFYETDKERLTINRFYPAILGANIGENIKGSFYLLYQSKRVGQSDDWNGEYILGTGLSF